MDEKKTERQRNPGQRQSQERGRGPQGDERNSSSSGSGISNRGMDRNEEQEDLPPRGWDRDSDGDSER